MEGLYAAITIDAKQPVKHHCEHREIRSHSWRIGDAMPTGVAYIQGTTDEIRDLARRLTAAAEKYETENSPF